MRNPYGQLLAHLRVEADNRGIVGSSQKEMKGSVLV